MKVCLIAWTPEPIKVIASQQRNMRGRMVDSLDEIGDEEASNLFEDVLKTNLQGTLEFVDFVFSISDVTRAFTHQLVRHRIGTSFSQESLRFTGKGDSAVAAGPTIVNNELMFSIYKDAVENIMRSYTTLMEMGASVEDARGLLPTNILTKIGFKCSYRALYDLAEQRLCLQAQQEFRDVVLAMKREVAEKVDTRLANVLQPMCVHRGYCPMGSIFDRVCSLQEKYPIR